MEWLSMSLCGKFRNEGHDWDDCICTRCLQKRNEAHTWNGCECSKCGAIRDQEHSFYKCVCVRCNKDIHDWEYDEHVFPAGVDPCTENMFFMEPVYKCTRCGKTQNR